MKSMPAQTVHLGIAMAGWAAALGSSAYSTPVQKRVVPVPPQVIRVVVASADRVVTYPDERWHLYGDWTNASLNYCSCVPAGETPPSPPAPSRTPPER
jgi:hypothetical protein